MAWSDPTAVGQPHFERGLFPDGSDVVVVARYADAIEVLRSPEFRVAFGANAPLVHEDPEGRLIVEEGPDGFGANWIDYFHGAEVHFLEEPEHTQRRRALGPLLARDAHLWFRDKVILPTLRRHLDDALLQPQPDGIARVDLVPFLQSLATQIAAALVGIEGADTPEGIDRLLDITRAIDRALSLVHDRVPVDDDELRDALEAARAARALFAREFYEPSLAARYALLERRASGDIGAPTLPHDLLTLVAAGAHTLEHHDAGIAQATAFLSPVISGHTAQLLNVLADLLDWLEAHPNDRSAWRDPPFLEAVIAESLRLHQPGVLPRQARSDVVLASGLKIGAGAYVAIMFQAANRDRAVFGSNADQFDPMRQVPAGVYRFGIAFGSGPHMCLASPLVMGQKGLSGSIAPVVVGLLEAGVSRDPDRPAALIEEVLPFRELYDTFPVTFSQRPVG